MQAPIEKTDVNNKLAKVTETDIYSSWDLDLRNLPPRSKLYSLAPINPGTLSGESLLSYFARLAFEYLMSPKKFLKFVIDNTSLSPEFTKYLRLSRTLNCEGDQTEILIDILQELTKRKDILYTTLLPYKERFYSFSSVKIYKIWCPRCFADQMITLNLNYEILIWTFVGTVKCYLHDIYMEKHCPYCDEKQKLNIQYYRPGYCSSCFKWLGDKEFLKSFGNTQEINIEVKKKQKLKSYFLN